MRPRQQPGTPAAFIGDCLTKSAWLREGRMNSRRGHRSSGRIQHAADAAQISAAALSVEPASATRSPQLRLRMKPLRRRDEFLVSRTAGNCDRQSEAYAAAPIIRRRSPNSLPITRLGVTAVRRHCSSTPRQLDAPAAAGRSFSLLVHSSLSSSAPEFTRPDPRMSPYGNQPVGI